MAIVIRLAVTDLKKNVAEICASNQLAMRALYVLKCPHYEVKLSASSVSQRPPHTGPESDQFV